MKKTIILCTTLFSLAALSSTVQGAPESKHKDHRRTQIAELAKDKETRSMMIHALMSTEEGKKELAEALKHDAQFRSYYDTNAVNPG